MFYEIFPPWQEDSAQSRTANEFRLSNSAQISCLEGMFLCFSQGAHLYPTLQHWAEGYTAYYYKR